MSLEHGDLSLEEGRGPGKEPWTVTDKRTYGPENNKVFGLEAGLPTIIDIDLKLTSSEQQVEMPQ